MLNSVSPPIKPASKFIELSDAVVISTIINGDDAETFLYWKEYEGIDSKLSERNRIKVGGRFHSGTINDLPSSNDDVVNARSINNPRNGDDEILIIRANGEMEIFKYCRNKKNVNKISSYILPQSPSGSYHIVGYICNSEGEMDDLVIAFYSGKTWSLIIAGNENFHNIDWGSYETVLGVQISQYGLGQRINFWLLGKKINDETHNFDSFASSHKHSVLSYDLNDFYLLSKGNQQQIDVIETNITDNIVFNNNIKKNCALHAHPLRAESNDEQLILCYLTKPSMDMQVLTALEIKGEGKNKTLDTINTSYIRGVHKSTLTCQDIHLFHRPDKTLFVIPCCVGTTGNVKLAVNVFNFNSTNSNWLNISHHTFNITDIDGSTAILPLGTASFMRMNNIKSAELRLFVKFYRSKGPRKTALRTSLLSASLLYDDAKNEVTWEHVSEGSYLTLPVWIDSGEMFEPKPDGSTAQLSSVALKTDLVGDSLTIGGPKLVPSLSFGQVFALYQAPPFETNINVTHPQMTISFNSSGQESNDITTHANVINNINESLTVGVWGQSLNAHFNDTWSQAKVAHLGLSSISDLSTAINVSQDDIVHLTTNAYNIWIYPIYQKSKSEDIVSEVSIIKPIRENVTTFIPTNNPDFFYDQDYENGMLLSYVNASKKGLKDSNLLFHPVSLPILGDRSSTSSISYMESNTTLKGNSITKDVTIGAGGSLTLNAQFGSLFSINNTLSFNHTQTSGNTSTSSSTLTKGFHISFNFGNVKDDVYQFQVTPLVYHQENTNLLLIKYDIELTGSKWRDYFSTPKPVLFRVFPFSEDVLSHSYTRSIRFTPTSEDNNEAALSILIFNNSLNPLSNLTCRIYHGLPKSDKDNQLTTDDLTLIKEVDDLTIDAASSMTYDLHDIIIKKSSFVTVELVHDSLLFKNQKIYWSSYPYNESSQYMALS